VISWSAYAPRRARDVGAWLRAKCIVSVQHLREELAALGVDPDTFPSDAAGAHLASLRDNATPEPLVNQELEPVVETASSDDVQAQAKRSLKRSRSTAS